MGAATSLVKVTVPAFHVVVFSWLVSVNSDSFGSYFFQLVIRVVRVERSDSHLHFGALSLKSRRMSSFKNLKQIKYEYTQKLNTNEKRVFTPNASSIFPAGRRAIAMASLIIL